MNRTRKVDIAVVVLSIIGIGIYSWGDYFFKPDDYKVVHYTGSLMVWFFWGYVLGRVMRAAKDKYLEF